MRILAPVLLLLSTLLAATPTSAAVPYCPVDDVTICTEHGPDAVRRTWADVRTEDARACVLLQTDVTGFYQHGAFTCGVEADTPLGESEVCYGSLDYVMLAWTDACLSHEGEVLGSTTLCYEGETNRRFHVSHVHEGCFSHADEGTGATHVCWDRWDAVWAGIVLTFGSACVEHTDPVTGTTRVDDNASRFTNGLLTVHEGGTTTVSTPHGTIDVSLDGATAFGAFQDWRTSGNVVALAGWDGEVFSDPLSQRLFAAACLRAGSANVCLP